jgi:hypothetical protein
LENSIPRLESNIFRYIFSLNGSFVGGNNGGFLKDGVKNYLLSPLNSPIFFLCLHIYSLCVWYPHASPTKLCYLSYSIFVSSVVSLWCLEAYRRNLERTFFDSCVSTPRGVSFQLARRDPGRPWLFCSLVPFGSLELRPCLRACSWRRSNVGARDRNLLFAFRDRVSRDCAVVSVIIFLRNGGRGSAAVLRAVRLLWCTRGLR